ncbi:MAG: hypothetical protein KGL39_52070 [Patescibacteria group bacterium]|nr:hypothetical protein [Patescibacteria group bacterium]
MEDSKKATLEYTIPPASKRINKVKASEDEFHANLMKNIVMLLEAEPVKDPMNELKNCTWSIRDPCIWAIGKHQCEQIRSELKSAGYTTKFFVKEGPYSHEFIVYISIGEYTFIKTEGKEIYPAEPSPPSS